MEAKWTVSPIEGGLQAYLNGEPVMKLLDLGPVETELATLRAENARLRAVLMDARTDIFHWVDLAERQLREIPKVDYLPSGPTYGGIAASKSLMDKIAAALAGGAP